MREIRTSGSEGGGTGHSTGPSYPYRSPQFRGPPRHETGHPIPETRAVPARHHAPYELILERSAELVRLQAPGVQIENGHSPAHMHLVDPVDIVAIYLHILIRIGPVI